MSYEAIVGAAGAFVGAALAAAHNKWRRTVTERPLYENGRREEIIATLRKIRRDIHLNQEAVQYLEDRIIDLERNRPDAAEFQREVMDRLQRIERRQQA